MGHDESGRAVRPRIAVLVRTHVVNHKVHHLLAMLKRGVGFDLFVCADETNGVLSISQAEMLGHSTQMCARIGLLPPQAKPRLLYFFGDYAFYCAYTQIPDYDYYVMLEFDVDFVRGDTLALEAVLNRLTASRGGAYDLVASQCCSRPANWVWSEPCRRRFGLVYGVIFPFVILSQRALRYLYDLRIAEAAHVGPDAEHVFCEAFVPSALKAAGDFRCADLTTLLPGVTDADSFRIGAPMLLGALPPLPRRVEFVHPVFAEEEFLLRMAQLAGGRGTRPS